MKMMDAKYDDEDNHSNSRNINFTVNLNFETENLKILPEISGGIGMVETS